MTKSEAPPRHCPPRYATKRTLSRKTLGGAARKISQQLGMELMDWQQQVIDVALELDENGMFAYKEVIVTVPRQSGKTTLMLSLILCRALALPNQRLVYTAQTRADASKKWREEWLPTLQISPFSDLMKIRQANGDESLLFENGSRQGLVASTAKAGHGQTLDLAIVDEAFAQPDARLEQALKPAMITRNQLPHRGAQLWIISTAGTLTASPYLLQKVEAGREIAASGLNNSVAYFEWSADPDADPADEETWWSCMPALGRTAPIEAVRADFLSMERHEFQRAYLNQWTTISVDPAIPVADWDALAVKDLDTSGIPVMLGVDVSPNRSASISAAGRLPNGKMFVELIKHDKGTKWVVPTLQTLTRENDVRAVVVDGMSPTSSLIQEIEDKVYTNLKICNSSELTKACGMLEDAVTETKALTHLGQQDVRFALDGGAKRPLHDGGWAWGRKNSTVDISPLVSITLAHWHAVNEGTHGAAAWNLNEIVAELRAKRAGEDAPSPDNFKVRAPEARPGGVTFIPLT